jgi:hypothetical protein
MRELGDLRVGRIGMAEYRQAEGSLGDEDIALNEFERRAGRVALIACSRRTTTIRQPPRSTTICAEPSTWPAGWKVAVIDRSADATVSP